MFVYEELLPIVFRLVNFGLLIFLCVYAFRRYILPVLNIQMEREHEYERSLEEKHKQLTNKGKMLDSFKQKQNDLYEHLSGRLREWVKIHHQQVEDKKKQHQLWAEQQKERIGKQEALFAQQRTLKIAAPRALNEARKQLEEQFVKDDKKRTYLEKVMSGIRKELS